MFERSSNLMRCRAALANVPIAATVIWTLHVAPSPAQAQQQANWCYSTDATVDQQINGCTAVIQSAVGDDDRVAIAYDIRGNAYYRKGNYESAIQDYGQALKIFPKRASIFRHRGNAYLLKKDYDRAIGDLSVAIRLDPNDTSNLVSRGDAYLVKPDYDLAVADYSVAIRLAPKDANTFKNRAMAYKGKGDYDRAIVDISKAIELNPKDADAFEVRGHLYYLNGQYDRAFADYTEAIKLNPNRPLSYNNRGAIYVGKGDYDHAIADYSQAIRLNPKYASAYYNRGKIYEAKGDYSRALTDFSEAIRINPNNTNIYYKRGNTRFELAEYDAAASDLAHTVQISPTAAYPVLWLYLAQAHAGNANARDELTVNSRKLKRSDWPYPILDVFLGSKAPEDILVAGGNAIQRCEAQFFIGEWYLLRNESNRAAELFNAAAGSCSNESFEYGGAVSELKRLERSGVSEDKTQRGGNAAR